MNHRRYLSWLSGVICVVLVLLLSACTGAGSAMADNTTSGTAANTTSSNVTTRAASQHTASGSSSLSAAKSQTALPRVPLKAIRMTDALHGWALDANNVLKTSDGGKSWVALTPKGAVIQPTTGADFLNARDAWFTVPNMNGGTITIFYTTTGGATWHHSIIHETDVEGGLLTFVNSQTGWLEVAPMGAGAGSEAVDILRTDNGGASWSKISSSGTAANALPNGGIKSGLSFINTTTGWATGAEPSNIPWLYITHDGGRTWSRQSIAGLSGNTQYRTLPPVFLGNNGFLPLGFSQTVLARTTDGGAHWTVSGQQVVPCLTNNLYVVNTQAAWATDQNSGDVCRTTNGGQSWQKIARNTNVTGPLSFVNTTTGFGLTSTGLKRTDDGGKTWQNIAYQIHG